MSMADEEKDYPGRVAYKKSGYSIRLAFKTAFETVHHGMTFESRQNQSERKRQDITYMKIR